MSSNLNFSNWLRLNEAAPRINYGGGIPSPHYRGQGYRYRPPKYDVGSWGSKEGKPLFKPGGVGELGLGSLVGDAKEKIGGYFYGSKGRPPYLTQNLHIKNTYGGKAVFDIEVDNKKIIKFGDEVKAAKNATQNGLQEMGYDIDTVDWDSFKVLKSQKTQNGVIVSCEVHKRQNYKKSYNPQYTPDEYEDYEDYEDDEPASTTPRVDVSKPPKG